MSIKKAANTLGKENIETYIKTALIFAIVVICFLIFKPFLVPVIWGIIIAIAFHPLHVRFTKLLKGKSGLSATIITLVLLALLLIPTGTFVSSLFENVKDLSTQLKSGELIVNEPPEKVAGWPLVGKSIYNSWHQFAVDVSAAATQFKPQIEALGQKVLNFFKSFMGTTLVFMLSIIISGMFLANAKSGYPFVYKLFNHLVGEEKGTEFVDNSRKTVSSVVTGILGTAVIQTAIISAALFVFKIPLAALLTLVTFFFAVAQIPVFLIIIPLIIYMFSAVGGAPAVLFTIWGIVGALSDNVLKPMLLGRGLNIPMLVILIGAIGGMLLMGMIGLFIGAVVMALGYQILQLWLDDVKEQLETTDVKNAED
ncbi:AI-2E family transporter [uncultured Draconibacterium sp.]|uniref:AI-2E family transporter n=1 Tax=uncultured Draconibacterium sp. TaxID=1573823 RepID=UPI0025F61429|nr:AI-2E family transporter [uncultured Draconibacterium sp.]